jgi:putative sigma-54 modulation protein
MQLDISGHHIEVTEAMKAHVRERFERIEQHFDTITDIHCVLTVEGDRHIAEATVNVRGKRLFAVHEEDDMYKSIDKLAHKLNRRVRKHKEKLHQHY